jgi:Nitronate monooxygenase
MLKTPLCDVFGIEVPIILAPMGTCTSAEFAAAVSNEGDLGGIGSLFRSTAAVKRDIDTIKRLTTRPFAINHIPQALDAEVFRYTLDARRGRDGPIGDIPRLGSEADLNEYGGPVHCLGGSVAHPLRVYRPIPTLDRFVWRQTAGRNVERRHKRLVTGFPQGCVEKAIRHREIPARPKL